jgi:hypothetical protein
MGRTNVNDVTGARLLTCRSCGDRVRVYEPQGEWIDPDRWTCGDCHRPVNRDAQLKLADTAERAETPAYDPEIADIGF